MGRESTVRHTSTAVSSKAILESLWDGHGPKGKIEKHHGGGEIKQFEN
jgi:hypothetical protein